MIIRKKEEVCYFTTEREDESISEVIEILRTITKEGVDLDVLEEDCGITFSFRDIGNAIELLEYLKEFGLGYAVDE